MATRKVSSQLLRCKSFISRSSRSPGNYSTTQMFLFFFLILSSLIFILPLNTAQAGQVTLAWNRNAEENVVGYNVYYGTSSGNYDFVIDVGDVTTITISDIPDGFTYYFAVTAYDDSSPSLESTYSNEVSKNTCTFSISPTSASFGASGGTGSVSVATQSGCTWSASSSDSWLTITSGSSGTGNGTIRYSVSANTTADARTASSMFAKKVFTVTQSGAVTHTINASAGAGGTISPSGSVSVAQGGNQSFTITPSTGYQVLDVTVDGTSVGAVSSYTFSNVTANHTISATFAVKTYTISASAGAGGSISPSGSVSVNHGANQSFTISPNVGYQITNVTVDSVSQGPISSYTFSNVTGNHTISASFAVNTYTITATAGTGGSLSPSGAISVSGGSNQTFTIAANTGYTISNVLVDGSSVGAVNTYTFTNVTSNHTISATFTANTYTISSSAGSNGAITPSGTVTVNHGGSQTFSITPSTGYQVLDVTVDGTSVGSVSSYTFSNVTANHTMSATFAVKSYTISASAGTGGSISPSGSVSVNHGANQSFTISPNVGYQITNVTVDSVSQGPISSYTFSNVTAAHTISTTFSPITYTIAASAGTGGSISPSGSVSVNHGASKTFSISANTGYTIADVLVDGASVGSMSSYTFSNVAGNHTISATFNQITFTINASAGTGGTISPAGQVTVAQGTNQTFTFIADSGYVVSNVVVDGSSLGASGSYTFTNVSASHAISVSFAQGYTLTVTKTGTGSGEVTTNPSSTVFRPGTKVTLKAIKADSSMFSGFSGDCNTYRTSCTLIMKKNANVNAAFRLKTFKVKTTVIGDGAVSVEEPVSLGDGTKLVQATKKEKIKKSKHEATIDYGDQVTFAITPEPGNNIKKVVMDSRSLGNLDRLTIADIKRNHAVKVSFEAEGPVPKGTQFETTQGRAVIHDEDEEEESPDITDDLAEIDEDERPIDKPTPAGHFASVVN